MDSSRKSFISHFPFSPNNNSTKNPNHKEDRQYLLNHREAMFQPVDPSESGEVVVTVDTKKTNNSCNKRTLNSSSEDADTRASDSPSTGRGSSKEMRVSFKEDVPLETSVRRRFRSSSEEDNRQPSTNTATTGGEEDDEDVVLCTPSKRTSRLLSTRTNSRLIDGLPEQDRKSGRAVKSGVSTKSGEFDEDEALLDGDIPDEYKRDTFSAFTLVQWVSLLLITAALVCSLSIRLLRKQTLWDLPLWKWAVMMFVLICGRLVSGWGIRIAVFFIERNFLLRKRVLYFVYGLRNSVQNCIWLSLVLVAWHYILDKKVEHATHSRILEYVTKILVCFLVGTLIWLLKTLIVKVLALSFHVNNFFDRIQDALFNQYVIEILSGPPLIEIKTTREEDERVIAEVEKLHNAGATMPADLRATIRRTSEGLEKSPRFDKSPRFSRVMAETKDERIPIDHLKKLNQWNVSAWNMKRLINIVRYGSLTTLDEQILDADMGNDSSMEIRSEWQAKEAAKKIFQNVAKLGSKHIYLEDLMRFMREDEALKAMHLFEGTTESKGISKRALKNWAVSVFRERKALALSLNDTKTAVDELHHMLNVVVSIIILVIWLIILGVAVTHFLVIISSQLLLVVFIFGNTCKTIFESIIFLFVMHPYDVGDRCEVEGVQMVVEEMNILTTVFLRYDNQKIIYPNSVLATKPISNYYRSPDMGDAIDFCIHISTPTEKIATMKQKITRYIESKEEHWYPAPMIVTRDVEDMNRLKFSVWLTHRMNHQDMGERWVRRSLLVEEMIKVFRELNIEYRMLPFDMNVRHLPNLVSNRLPSNWTTCAS